MNKNRNTPRIKHNQCYPTIKATTRTKQNGCCRNTIWAPSPPGPSCLSLCDCCAYPLQSVLQQLVGKTVILATIADAPNAPPLVFLFTIIEVNDFLVTVTDGVTTYVINISDVIGVGFLPPGPTINLLPPVPSGCECDCRERPIRQLLDTLIGSTVNLLVSNGSTATNFNVEQTGLGIVVGTLPINKDEKLVRFAISTCKITAVGTLELPSHNWNENS